MSATTDRDEEDCIVSEYPADCVGTSNYTVVLNEPEESPYVDGKTEFFAGEYCENFGDCIKLTTAGDAVFISKDNISKIVKGESQN